MKQPTPRLRLISVLLFLACWTVAPSAWAYKPLRNPTQLDQPKAETVLRVRTARVVLLDYGLIRRDFAETRAMTDDEIDQWLLDQTAYISRDQAAQTVSNTPIELTGATRSALRPKDYGRALVYETGHGGLIDVKGAGIAENVFVTANGHRNGLATLGEATREFLYEKLVHTVFAHSGSKYETVEHYGVIDLGFDVVHEDGSTSPAGLVLRQANQRMNYYGGMPDAETRSIELVLRKYGLTSAGVRRNEPGTELLNIQGTPDGAVLDFGGYLSVENFDRPAKNYTGLNHLLEPGQIDFIQPVATIRVPWNDWGYGISGVPDPKMDNPWIWSHELARNYRAGLASRASFQKHFDNLVGKYRRDLFFLGDEADSSVMEGLVRAIRDVH